MTFLSAVMPGIRDIRTPFVVGALWVASILLVGQGWWQTLSQLDAVKDVQSLLLLMPAVGSAIAVFATYLLGTLMHGLAQSSARNQLIVTIGQKGRASSRPRIAWAGGLLSLHSRRSEAFVASTIREKLMPISPMIAGLTPTDMVLDEIDLAGLRLSKEAPDQFQQYDRTKAEGQFRTAICLPLLVLGLICSWKLPLLPGLGLAGISVFASLALLLQGLDEQKRADELLTGAIYFGYASTPILDNLVASASGRMSRLEDQPEPDPDSHPNLPRDPVADRDAADLAWFADFLADRGLLDRYSTFLSKVRHPSLLGSGVYERAVPRMKSNTRIKLADVLGGGYLAPEKASAP